MSWWKSGIEDGWVYGCHGRRDDGTSAIISRKVMTESEQ
jgi:hypothetical protein